VYDCGSRRRIKKEDVKIYIEHQSRNVAGPGGHKGDVRKEDQYVYHL
jgi:hypothetical protein